MPEMKIPDFIRPETAEEIKGNERPRWGAKASKPPPYYVMCRWGGGDRMCINCPSVEVGARILKKRPSWLYMVEITLELYRRDNIEPTGATEKEADKWKWDAQFIRRAVHPPDLEKLKEQEKAFEQAKKAKAADATK